MKPKRPAAGLGPARPLLLWLPSPLIIHSQHPSPAMIRKYLTHNNENHVGKSSLTSLWPISLSSALLRGIEGVAFEKGKQPGNFPMSKIDLLQAWHWRCPSSGVSLRNFVNALSIMFWKLPACCMLIVLCSARVMIRVWLPISWSSQCDLLTYLDSLCSF